MKDIVFDVNVILDVLLNRQGAEIAEQLFEQVQTDRFHGWVTACSLAIIEYLVLRELKASGVEPKKAASMTTQLMDWLTHSLKSLSVPGPESLKLLGQSKDFEDAQIALSALLELGDKAVIVSNDKHFDAMGKLTVLTPAACLEKLEQVDKKQ